MRYHIVLFFIIISAFYSQAQVGGTHTFAFLDLPYSARIAATGGVNASNFKDGFFSNPALAGPQPSKPLQLTFYNYFSGIRYGAFAYSHPLNEENLYYLNIGVNSIGYGEFKRTTSEGTDVGTFSAGETVFSLGMTFFLKNFSYGYSIRYLESKIAEYSSNALLADLGIVYKHPVKEFTAGVTWKQIGFQTKTYTGGNKEPLPDNLQVGITHKLEHMPMRYSLTAHTLNQWDIVYLDQSRNIILDDKGNPVIPQKKIEDKIMSHITVGTELLVGKNLVLRAGYSHQRRQEFRLDEKTGGAGFSWGLGICIKGFTLDYARATYLTGATINFFTLTMDLNSFIKTQLVKTDE
ncbi:MAG: hypothetical protein A3H98_11805 [Bacteroidetes bacterium RIFCSPLOWO2_02_FULL_36_8]|nr:MAG: hypothetical protein A3H98_11805 [Bacteroidetes bacterium RIFCSPLOWO2_02_FULL_36_8]OFY69449.1 MAG: hypothetical protein A3G23_00845 [Bacteroidetes bacterium RIFCSPLOWO2_12_FULL_37_12]